MKTNSLARLSVSRFMHLPRGLGLCLLGALLAGCPAEKSAPTSEAAPAAGAASDKVVVRGSNTIGEELAPKLIAEFKKDHAGADFDTEFKGTGYGLGALSSDKCDIAAASRVVSSNELDLLKENNMDVNETIIGHYAVVVVVNAGNTVSDLSREQVRDIFTGAIQNWKDVGGPDAPIHLYIRNPVSGTYLGFQELAMERKDYAHPEKAPTTYAEIVQEVAKDPAGIGYSAPLTAKVEGAKAVSIGGIEPSSANINKGDYPYARVLRFYTNKTKTSTPANDFIQFALSSKGQGILADTGFVPK